jgi:hypothetical protein
MFMAAAGKWKLLPLRRRSRHVLSAVAGFESPCCPEDARLNPKSALLIRA